MRLELCFLLLDLKGLFFFVSHYTVFIRVTCELIGTISDDVSISVADPDPHGQMLIRIQEVKKPRKSTNS